jgi:hypothetical protein
MPVPPRERVGPPWSVRSVAVRCRDGPDRMLAVYRLLLADPPDRPLPRGASAVTDVEGADAGRDLRPRLD